MYAGTANFSKVDTLILVPDTSVCFGTTAIPIPYDSVSSIRNEHGYRTLRQVQYINTGTGHGTLPSVRYDIRTDTIHFGKFSTSIPVPETLVISVRHSC